MQKTSEAVRPVADGWFARARAGDRDAIEVIARWFYHGAPRHRARLAAKSFGLESDELLQVTVTQLLYGQYQAKFQDTNKLLGFVYTVCRNEARGLVRKLRKCCQPADGQLEEVASPEESNTLDAVLDALNSLSTADQAVVKMHCLDGLTYVEIGTAIGLSRGTVGTRYREAMSKLRMRLEGKL
jgi:RNA polymerase sigma factor (sigma-70 family)